MQQIKKIGEKTLIKMTSSGGKFIKVKVEILEIKKSYGRIRYLITPIEGEGQLWIEKI